ncbi:efflux RND transporter periplasmic adaptor subunit [Chitinolyticbacter albus]|uniref:efflux RND transporter periplasmic adaptor subunit n=1 Tax=Chitinolyticbacter albus TaxID=2961951 RepID=UPI00210C4437|nr:efflux RND transporter periplasmic adaptor subunit [Chitinolyticbacter albus]
MKARIALITVVILAVGVAAWLGLADGKTPQPSALPKHNSVELATADVARVTRADLARALPLTGTLAALQQTTLTAQVDGRIAAVEVRPGDAVRTGQVLARFDTADLERQRAVSAAQLAKSREQLAYQQKLSRRNADLLAQNFISKNAFDNTQSELQAAAADERAALAQLGLAEQAITNATVRAPFAGTVASRQIEPGQHVGINSPLFTVVDLSELELVANVPSAQIAEVKLGQTVNFHVQGYTQAFTGSINRINPTVDEATKTIPLYLRVPNPDGALRSGLFADGLLVLDTRSAVPSLPLQAVHADGKARYVLAIEEGKLVRRDVTLGASDLKRDRVEIAAGIAAGAQVLASNARLPPGTAVTIVADSPKQ